MTKPSHPYQSGPSASAAAYTTNGSAISAPAPPEHHPQHQRLHHGKPIHTLTITLKPWQSATLRTSIHLRQRSQPHLPVKTHAPPPLHPSTQPPTNPPPPHPTPSASAPWPRISAEAARSCCACWAVSARSGLHSMRW